MPRCPNCSYKLVLLSSRLKYKCALCSKLFPKKEIEVREFQEFNKRRRIEDLERYEKEKEEQLARIRELRRSLRLLFNGPPKSPKEYRREYYQKNKERIKLLSRKWKLKNRNYVLKKKREYYQKNKNVIRAKAKLWVLNNQEQERQRQNRYRKENRATMRVYGMIQHYRCKQKALALRYLKNNGYKPSTDDIFHSVPTYSLSYLLSQ